MAVGKAILLLLLVMYFMYINLKFSALTEFYRRIENEWLQSEADQTRQETVRSCLMDSLGLEYVAIQSITHACIQGYSC